MTSEERIINGSFKGVPISIVSGSVDGGRKVSVKQFPSRDTQNVEDLGALPRKYALNITISDKQGQDYFQYRDALLAALEQKGPGELIHPLYGRVSDIVAVSYSMNERFSEFGITTISVNFETTQNTGIPTRSRNVVSAIASANTAVQQSVSGDVAELFEVNPRATGNFAQAVADVEEFIALAAEAAAFIGEEAQSLDEFVAKITTASDDVSTLVAAPGELASSFSSIMSSANGLYQNASSRFETFIGFFDFGADDVPIQQNTAARVERQKNTDVLNGAVAGSALSYAYLAATQIKFETTRQIDELTARLDTQYDLTVNAVSSQDTKDSITDMRVKVLQALDDKRVNAKQVITVETSTTSTRLLSFSYYGNDDFGETVTDLNQVTDVSFIEGPVEVLTA